MTSDYHRRQGSFQIWWISALIVPAFPALVLYAGQPWSSLLLGAFVGLVLAVLGGLIGLIPAVIVWLFSRSALAFHLVFIALYGGFAAVELIGMALMAHNHPTLWRQLSTPATAAQANQRLWASVMANPFFVYIPEKATTAPASPAESSPTPAAKPASASTLLTWTSSESAGDIQEIRGARALNQILTHIDRSRNRSDGAPVATPSVDRATIALLTEFSARLTTLTHALAEFDPHAQDLTRLKDRAEAQSRVRQVQELRAAAEALRDFSQGLEEELARQLKELKNVTPQDREAVQNFFIARWNPPAFTAFYKTEADVAETVEGLLVLLRSEWGEWQIGSGGKVEFRDEMLAARFGKLARKLAELQAREATQADDLERKTGGPM